MKTILFVDDDPEWRSMVGIRLHGDGFKVATAGTIHDSMKSVQANKPDLAIVDVNLADEDGIQLMGLLKQTLPTLPVILFTALDHDDDTILQLMQEGAHQYVRKGKITDLLHAVRMLLVDQTPPRQPDSAG